jgi:hypothetical protein
MSSSSQPRFDASVIDAYNELARLESPNDFLVGGFQSAGDKLLLSLVAKGKGGMGAVKQVLGKCSSPAAAPLALTSPAGLPWGLGQSPSSKAKWAWRCSA